MQIEAAVIAAVSTLLGVSLTLFFTNRREKVRFIQELKIKEYNDLELFYINLFSTLDKTIRYTERGDDYKELVEEIALLNAKVNLISTTEINEKLSNISNLLFEWSILYKQSLPKKIGESGIGIISNENIDFKEQADKIFPRIKQEIGELFLVVKAELKERKTKIEK